MWMVQFKSKNQDCVFVCVSCWWGDLSICTGGGRETVSQLTYISWVCTGLIPLGDSTFLDVTFVCVWGLHGSMSCKYVYLCVCVSYKTFHPMSRGGVNMSSLHTEWHLEFRANSNRQNFLSHKTLLCIDGDRFLLLNKSVSWCLQVSLLPAVWFFLIIWLCRNVGRCSV